jgi:CheY-like chemotaxis protein
MTEAPHNILVVDDEFASLEVLALLLVGEGFRVVMASDGEEALLRLTEAETIDLVITDYKMPKMDGSELCLKMVADPRLRSIPVIFTSATYRQDVPRPSNVVAFFSKPLLFSELLRSVHRILSRRVTPPSA